MTDMLREYRIFVDRGVSLENDTVRERLLLAALGLNTEAGEAGDIVKKACFHDQQPLSPEQRAKLVLELGDVFWYFTLLLKEADIAFEEVISKNVKKLSERYPERHMAGVAAAYTEHLIGKYEDLP